MTIRSGIILCIALLLTSCAPPIAENPTPLPVRSTGALMQSMTTPRALHSATLLRDGKILICGGTATANIGGVLNTAEI